MALDMVARGCIVPPSKGEASLAVDPNKEVTLKIGDKMRLGDAWSEYKHLESLFERDPSLFNSLFLIAFDEPKRVPAETVAMLETQGFLSGGQIRQETRDVLHSACEMTLEGMVIVNPFLFDADNEAREVEQYGKEYNDRLWSLLERGKRKKKDDPNRPPSLG